MVRAPASDRLIRRSPGSREAELLADWARRLGHPVPRRSLDLLISALYRVSVEENGGRPPDLQEWLDLVEGWRIAHVLEEEGGNLSSAARVLGLGRRTLYRRLEKLGHRPGAVGAGVSARHLRS